MRVTAETITDKQIRELRDTILIHEAAAADVYRMCQDALGELHHGRLSAEALGARIDYARARCAEILNARKEQR